MAKQEQKSNNDTYVEIITSLISAAAPQVEGVANISSEVGALSIRGKRKNRSIVVDIIGSQVVVNISINAVYGYNIPLLACNLQETLKREIENATFYKVKQINVNIVGMAFPS